MPRIKVPRKSTAIDMTAMCDVAFLLLTFFILTAKPKVEDPVPVDTPKSATEVTLPESGVALITVGKGKTFLTLDGPEMRKQTLLQMGSKYNIGFTPSEVKQFQNLDAIGVPVQSIKQFLALDPEQRKAFLASPNGGIPTDSVSNEMFNWIRESRVVEKNISGKELRFSIKGDSNEEYPTMQRLIAILQKQKVNKFSLITSLRAK
jgi:biopolymer transport protein ExbD